MENLKISFNISSPLLINRYTTIDSILLYHYFKLNNSDGTKSAVECDFIAKEHNTLSGSVWFVEDETILALYPSYITKKTEFNYLNENRKKIINYEEGKGNFKNFLIWSELLIVPKIYFYIRGNKEKIEEILKNVSFIGKKQSIGYGKVESYKIEVVKDDKGFKLDNSTASKPLPLDFKLSSNKVAYWNRQPPYWDKTRLEPCYMPNNALIETLNKAQKQDNYKKEYISATVFTYSILGDNKEWRAYKVDDINHPKNKVSAKVDIVTNEEHTCAMCGTKAKRGKKGKKHKLKDVLSDTFNDFAYLDSNNFICEACLWSLENGFTASGKPTLGFHFIDENGISFVMGKNKTKTAKEVLKEAKIPFSFCFKTTANNQHTVFKSKLTISKDLTVVQYGDETVYFNLDEVNECISEMQRIVKDYPLKKNHLLPNPQVSDKSHSKLSNEAKKIEDIYKILSNFFKKYDRGTRIGAYIMLRE